MTFLKGVGNARRTMMARNPISKRAKGKGRHWEALSQLA